MSSILGKNWKIKNSDTSKNTVQKILENRGLIEPESIKTFLEASYKKGFHNPFLMKDMDKAVERIKTAISKQERIMIFGDYDVDGISGTAILMHTLKLLGARVSYRLPHRVDDGYGLSDKFIDEFIKLGVNVLITVDCGISCKNQITRGAEKGLDVIISDHHTIPQAFPDRAYAILHPMQPGCTYPFKGLTGAGVAYKLASALLTDVLDPLEREKYLYSLLDLASLGTVADLGPLKDENRIIVKYGLEAMQNTKWHGLNYLKEYAGIDSTTKLDISVIGFRIGPRINAAGRIDHPYYALQLLLQDEPGEKAKLLAEHLEKLNQKRQQMVTQAIEEVENYFLQQQSNQKIYIAWSPNWHVGILGLLASKIVDKYGRPCIVLQDLGDHLVASGRCPENFNMTQALASQSRFLDSFGGHAQAAGFNLKKEHLEDFAKAMTIYAEEKLKEHHVTQDLNIDCELQEDDINTNLLSFLEQLEPFGIGNEQPNFLLRNISPLELKKVGKERQHLYFQAQYGNKKFPVIAFKFGAHEDLLRQGKGVDLVCNVSKNEWRGTTHIQLKCVDFREHEEEVK